MNVEQIVANIKREITLDDENIPIYLKKRLEEWCKAEQIVIFGKGTYGKKMYGLLRKFSLENKVVGFCDNSLDKCSVLGVAVFSPSEAVNKFPNAVFIITPKYYENEIMRQLYKEGVSPEKICIVISSYLNFV